MADHTRQLQEPELIDDGLSSSKTPRTADQRLAGPLSRITSDLFRGILQHPDRLPSTAYRRVEREYGYFQLWCDGYGVLSGALDCDLVASKRLRLMTYRRISEVCQALISIATTMLGPKSSAYGRIRELLKQSRDVLSQADVQVEDGDDSDSDTESDIHALAESGSSTLESFVEDVATSIQCLVDLGPRFDEPVLDEPRRGTAVPLAGPLCETAHPQHAGTPSSFHKSNGGGAQEPPEDSPAATADAKPPSVSTTILPTNPGLDQHKRPQSCSDDAILSTNPDSRNSPSLKQVSALVEPLPRPEERQEQEHARLPPPRSKSTPPPEEAKATVTLDLPLAKNERSESRTEHMRLRSMSPPSLVEAGETPSGVENQEHMYIELPSDIWKDDIYMSWRKEAEGAGAVRVEEAGEQAGPGSDELLWEWMKDVDLPDLEATETERKARLDWDRTILRFKGEEPEDPDQLAVVDLMKHFERPEIDSILKQKEIKEKEKQPTRVSDGKATGFQT